jgi:hypothetical protein
MRTTDLRDLTSTVEALRAELHPDLDGEFLQAVIRAEDENQEDDEEALRRIQAALNAVLLVKGAA